MPPTPPPDAAPPPLPRAQVRTACAVVGCLGLAVVGAVAALVYIVLTILGDLAPQPSDTGKDKAKPKALARPDPVRPTALAKPADAVPLEAAFDAVGRAANGRYLLLRQPARAELAVFDPVAGKVIRSVPLGEPRALFAGGAGKLYVYRPKAKELDRYDLVTWEKEATAKKPDGFPDVTRLLVGDAVDGPVLAVAAGERGVEVAVIDPAPASWALHRPAEWKFLADAKRVRISADGRTIGAADKFEGTVLRFTPPAKFEAEEVQPLLAGHVSPAADGRAAFTARGIKRTGDMGFSSPPLPVGKEMARSLYYTFPAAHGGSFYLVAGHTMDGKFEPPLRVYSDVGGEVAALTGVRFPAGINPIDDAEVPMDQRIHLWPAAGLLAVLPAGNRRVELTKVDFPELLKGAKGDYVAFGSEPPLGVARGQPWVYEPVVWANGPVTFEAAGRPEGFQFRGPVAVWTPQSTSDDGADIRIRARTADGQVAEQAFRVQVFEP